MPKVTVNISQKNYDNIVKISNKTALKKSELLNEALEVYLDELSEDITEGKRISAEIKAGKQKVYTSEEVRKELGL